MGFFKKFAALFSPTSVDNRSLWMYVKCDKCGEILKGRVDLMNDLSVQYQNSGNKTTYYCRKVFVGSNRCYRPIEVELTFNKSRQLIEEEITGGVRVSEEDYLAANPDSNH